MDSLLASYASSDEDDDQKESKSSNPIPSMQSKSTTKTLFSSLPPPKSSSSSSSPSLLFSLPPPKSHLPNPSSISSPSSSPLISSHSTERQQSVQNMETTTKLSASLPKTSTSLFSSLPQPKSSSASSLFSSLPQPKIHSNIDALHSSPVVPAKRVVQFRPPPMNPPSSSSAGSDDEDENDEDEEDKQKKKQETIQTSSVKSFLSSIPAPRNSATLGVSSSSSGTGRRSIIDADVPGLKNSNVVGTAMDNEAGVSTHGGYYESQSGVDQASISSGGGVSESSGYAVGGGGAGADYSNWTSGSENYAGYGGYVGYDGVSGDYQNGDYTSYNNGNDANYGQYESNWADDSTPSVVPEGSGLAESAFKLSGKRGRNDVPQVILEVKQDELIKNRPREDQVKLTGIAFGPSYQPASTKGKPSKLHKRKHQIGSLFFDMKQKETELAERRARGFLTKAQTQGKYGW